MSGNKTVAFSVNTNHGMLFLTFVRNSSGSYVTIDGEAVLRKKLVEKNLNMSSNGRHVYLRSNERFIGDFRLQNANDELLIKEMIERFNL